jgi:tetratricopeptide (TPR) repeat protein
MIHLSRSDIEQRYRRVVEAVSGKRFKSALDELSLWVRFGEKQEFFYQLETLGDNYRTLLRYAFEGYKDPQQQTMLKKLAASILSLADDLKDSMREPQLPFRFGEQSVLSREFGSDTGQWSSAIEEILVARQVKQLIGSAEEGSEEKHEPLPAEVLDKIFKLLWLTRIMPENQVHLLRRINHSAAFEWHEKCVIVSAVTLSLLTFFDPRKFIVLAEFAETGESQVSERALVGLMLGLIVYDQRIVNYPEIAEKLSGLRNDSDLLNQAQSILLQYLMARETEKITKEFEEEVLPEMKKMMPRLEDKLQLGDQTEEEDMEGKNPGWKGIVNEVPGLFEKIEKYSRMQMEGGDVFMSTFQMLKRFDFFNRMCNWFIPFYRDNPEAGTLLTGQDDLYRRLFDSLESAFYICNSDKYSFILNFSAIPAQQRNLIVTNFEAELAQMTDMASEEQILDKSLKSNSIIIQYIQDLYRFFRIFPGRGEFDDVFRRRISFQELYFYRTFFEQEPFTRRLAEFYFDKAHYYEAIDLYDYIASEGTPNAEFYEKIAFCYQKLGRYKKAIEYYKKAELFDTDRLWILKKLGWCCLKLKDYQNAVTYFRDASEIQPDDQSLQTQLAHCYLNLKDYTSASQIFSRLLFFNPGNVKYLRPSAYCDFVGGKLDQALDGYNELLSASSAPTAYDLMNAGHVYLCKGNRKKALELYTRSLLNENFREEDFISAFDEDVPHLLRYGILADDIPLIKDHLSFQTEKS